MLFSNDKGNITNKTERLHMEYYFMKEQLADIENYQQKIPNNFFINQAFLFFKQDNKSIKLSDMFELFSKLLFNHNWNVVNSKKNLNFHQELEKSISAYKERPSNNTLMLKLIQKLKKIDNKHLIYNPQYENTINDLNKKTNTKVSMDDIYIGVFETFFLFLLNNYEEFISIQTGFLEIDENIHFGLKRKSISVIASESGVGKSFFCTKVSVEAIQKRFNNKKQNLKVLHFIGDNAFEFILNYYLCVFNNIPLKNSKERLAKDSNKILANAEEINQINFVKTYEENKKPVNLIEKIKEKFLEKNYDLIIIDDLSMYVENISNESSNEHVETLAPKARLQRKIMQELKNLANEYNCAILTTSKLMQNLSQLPNSNPVTLSFGVSEISDLILKLDKLQKTGYTGVSILKNRYGLPNITKQIKLFK